MLGRFNEIFGIQDDLLIEQLRFVERINQTAFPEIEQLSYPISYQRVFEMVCYGLGTNANDRISKANQNNYFSSETFVPPLRTLTRDEFKETIKVLGFLYRALNEAPRDQETLSGWIETALEQAILDLGITWRQGMFYRSGAKELDEKLIEEPFKWLDDFPNEKADYLKAAAGYSNKKLDDVIINCYLAVEGVARNILGNKKTLDNNREGLMQRLGLSREWKALLGNFITYANEFKRHASENRHNLNSVEVEGFLYLTGVLLRMMILTVRAK